MSDDYNVVFENTPELGGYAFVRTIINYQSEKHFQEVYKPNSGEKIVAQGLSYEDSVKLCYLTPIISYYLAAIEDMFEMTQPEPELIDYFIFKAAYAAKETLKSRREADLKYTAPRGIEGHLQFLASQPGQKARLMAAFIKPYFPDLDFLPIHLADLYFKQALLELR